MTLHWHERSYPARIVKRWFDADNEDWWYEVAGFTQRFPESAIEPQLVESFHD